MRAPLFSLSRAVPLVSMAAALAFASCGDPVHDNAVKALGGEAPGVPTGPFHRPGQACTVCHGQYGPASDTQFVVGGTVFHDTDRVMGEPGVAITIQDGAGARKTLFTNCAGNFFIFASDWPTALFPMKVVSMQEGPISLSMKSHIGREGSCNQCHKDPPRFDSAGHLSMHGQPTDPPPAGCPVNPDAAHPGPPPP